MPICKMMFVTLCQSRRYNQFQVALREIPSLLKGSVDVSGSIGQVFPHRSMSRRVEIAQSLLLLNLL
jgi:hypothetical protein